MKISKVAGCLILIGCVIAWLYFWCDTHSYWNFNRYESSYDKDNDWLAWVCLIIRILGYISSRPLCGFGKLVDDVNQTKKNRYQKKAIVKSL